MMTLEIKVHTQVHDVVAADSTVVDDNIPGPEGDSVPLDDRSVSRSRWLPRLLQYLLDLELFLITARLLGHSLALR